MNRIIKFVGLGLLLVLVSADDPATTEKRAPMVTPYVRALRTAVERAQSALERTRDLWQDHSTWENAWQVRSGPYNIRTTHSRKLGLSLGRSLETILEEFKFVLKPDFTTRGPLNVYIYPALAQYNTFGNDNGEHHSSLYGSFYADTHEEGTVAVLYDINDTLLVMFATHSALHQFIDKAFTSTPPTWISEGLASYYSFRWAYSWGVSQLKELIDTNRYIPLAQVMRASIEDYGDNAHAYFTELGMFFYYLLDYREDTWITEENEGACAAYLRAILGGANPSQLPFHEMITQRLDQLEADFKAFSFPAQ